MTTTNSNDFPLNSSAGDSADARPVPAGGGVRRLPFVFRYTEEMDKPYVLWATERKKELAEAFKTIATSQRAY